MKLNKVVRGRGINIGERFIALSPSESVVRELLAKDVDVKCQPGFFYVLNTTRNAIEASFGSKVKAIQHLEALSDGRTASKHIGLIRVESSELTQDDTDEFLRYIDSL